MRSVPPPAVNGTTSSTGLVGYACAKAGAAVARASAASKAAAARRDTVMMFSLSRWNGASERHLGSGGLPQPLVGVAHESERGQQQDAGADDQRQRQPALEEDERASAAHRQRLQQIRLQQRPQDVCEQQRGERPL